MNSWDLMKKTVGGELALRASAGLEPSAFRAMVEQAAEAQSALDRLEAARGLETVRLAQEATGAVERYRELMAGSTTERLLREHYERDRVLREAAGLASQIDFTGLRETMLQMEWARSSVASLDFDALTRQARWAQNLTVHEQQISSLRGAVRGIDFDSLTMTARVIADASRLGEIARMTWLVQEQVDFEMTALKMSTFAAAIDTQQSPLAIQSSYLSLLGGWHTHAELPEAYWRSRATRAAMYREADVDPGVIDAPNAVVVEALVESGVVEGNVSGAGRMSAKFEIGGVQLRIAADRAPTAVFRAITVFERRLRRFVEDVLAPVAGPKWFEQRSPGIIVAAAKDRRKTAMRDGETMRPLIDFSELGDLMQIILRADNWPFFEPFFGRRDYLSNGIESLIVSRRPAYHARGMDSVRLLESLLILVKFDADVRRGTSRIEGWDEGV